MTKWDLLNNYERKLIWDKLSLNNNTSDRDVLMKYKIGMLDFEAHSLRYQEAVQVIERIYGFTRY